MLIYIIVEDSMKKRKKQTSWNPGTENGGKSSLDLIVEWLTTYENYERWCGADESKKDVAKAVMDFLSSHGKRDRNRTGVMHQVSRLICNLGSTSFLEFFELY